MTSRLLIVFIMLLGFLPLISLIIYNGFANEETLRPIVIKYSFGGFFVLLGVIFSFLVFKIREGKYRVSYMLNETDLMISNGSKIPYLRIVEINFEPRLLPELIAENRIKNPEYYQAFLENSFEIVTDEPFDTAHAETPYLIYLNEKDRASAFNSLRIKIKFVEDSEKGAEFYESKMSYLSDRELSD